MAKKETKSDAQDYAVIETGGKQYRVEVGDKVLVEKISGVEDGKEVIFDRVLAIKSGDAIKVGAPIIDGAKVKAKALKSVKEDKLDIFKKKRRKGYTKKIGHRQEKLAVEVTAIG